MSKPERQKVEQIVKGQGWLIHKAGRGWYRPNAQGYTLNPAEAGRYSKEEALRYSHPNGHDGPRDGMTIKHESEVAGALPSPMTDRERTLVEAADMQKRLAELESMNKVITESHKWLYGETQRLERALSKIAELPHHSREDAAENMRMMEDIARAALPDKTQETNDR